MKRTNTIVTVGLWPAWDRICEFDGIEWGEHKLVSASWMKPAGKAMNVSYALAWMGQKSIAAGLWGQDDTRLLLQETEAMQDRIDVRVTPAAGATRQNVTVVDTKNEREMHLRHRSKLASRESLRRLRHDLSGLVAAGSTCVFAGSMPEGDLLADVIMMIELCIDKGAKVVVDTSGPALQEMVETGMVWAIKPNVEEFRRLVGRKVADRPASLARAARPLLAQVEVVLISRGEKGALLVTHDGGWQASCSDENEVHATVGCGDYMLAGFLKGLRDTREVAGGLEAAVKAGSAHAWGWTGSKSWDDVRREVDVEFKAV